MAPGIFCRFSAGKRNLYQRDICESDQSSTDESLYRFGLIFCLENFPGTG